MSGVTSRAARALALVVLLAVARVSADEPISPVEPLAPLPACPETGDAITVSSRNRELWLCRDGAAIAKYRIALGRGGVDKRREGDGRTPVGTYALGSPRSSAQFGLFIPIDYPTPEQAAQGFTGGNVGIHGPPRGVSAQDYPLTVIDWTRGCIATAQDDDIASIAEFVRTRQPIVVIR